MDNTKIYEFDPNHPGDPTVKTLENAPVSLGEPWSFKVGDRTYKRLSEVASTSQFPVLLRDGLKTILYDAFNNTATTFQDWCMMAPSTHQSETYLKSSTFGTLPRVDELEAYPEVDAALEAPVTVENHKYGGIFSVNTMAAFC